MKIENDLSYQEGIWAAGNMAKNIDKTIYETLKPEILLITLGSNGMLLVGKGILKHIPTKAIEVFDVSGAGDTVVAAISMALISGATLPQAAEIANFAAGLKVRKVGTAPVYLDELKQAISS